MYLVVQTIINNKNRNIMENLIKQAELMQRLLATNATLVEIEEQLTNLLFDQACSDYTDNQ
tara:strand:- start:8061 stop:8243 length:183 start_codon:yes stop_codon:yes gene_type:complete